MEDEGASSRIVRKVKEEPMLGIGVLGFLSMLGYAALKFRTRKEPTSLFLIHTRMRAQGAVIGAITVGVGYSMFKDYVYPKIHKTDTPALELVTDEENLTTGK